MDMHLTRRMCALGVRMRLACISLEYDTHWFNCIVVGIRRSNARTSVIKQITIHKVTPSLCYEGNLTP
jgi:hypothetical protein